tara:strand:- start:1335 stop:1499 length:165 start_codon:yes stop_codon:yes gene_type:complete
MFHYLCFGVATASSQIKLSSGKDGQTDFMTGYFSSDLRTDGKVSGFIPNAIWIS